MTVQTISYGRKALTSDILADVARNLVRWLLLALGLVLILFGILIAPLPGPLGVPFTVGGLILILRNSFRLRRLFIRVQRRHPRYIFPLRRLLRREPEILPVAWQQALRIERMLLPRSWRTIKQLRRRYFRFR